ncbi:MAG: extracellular solute-binding protein [Acidobacteriota bacterium]
MLEVVLAIAIGVWIWPAALAYPPAEEPLLLVRMPDEESLDHPPSDFEIARFVREHQDNLYMRVEDLMSDRDLARHVLGQRQIFQELAEFQRQHRIAVKVKFIYWADAFRYFVDYISDPSNPQVVAQLGDTWAAYFRSLGVLSYERRHTWDVRLLWYWKDLVSAEEIGEGEGFAAACARLRRNPPPELIAPFAIPTALDWNLLHDLSIWLHNAGLPSLVSLDRKLGLIPWKEAVFAGPEGERVARFLIRLTENGYLVLPEKTDLTEDFLLRKYAMVILGTWLPDRAEKKFGPGWQSRIGGTLPPKIGAPLSTTIKGGSLLAVLDPGRSNDRGPIDRARRLIDFFASKESQQRYTQALAALPANPEALAEFRYYPLFETALKRGRTYPQIPEWAPVVENLATRDNIYAFWKRLSAVGHSPSAASGTERAIRESLILAALNSAQADINKELSPGKLSFLRPWLLAVAFLVGAITLIAFWHRRVERIRTEELRQTRDSLATLERRLARVTAAESQERETPFTEPRTAAKGFPALYLDGLKRRVLLKRVPSAPLEEIIHGTEFDLFRHIIEGLQVGWYETHWIWTHVIWPAAHAKFPKGAFATHCTKLRKEIEKVWQLGEMLGRGSRHGGAMPIEVRDVHFYTDAEAEDGAYPIWSLFQAWEEASKAHRTEQWVQAQKHVEEVLRIDPGNWPANILLCWSVTQKHGDPQDELVRKAIEFARKQKAIYEQAAEKIKDLSEERLSLEQKERMLSRLDNLRQLTSQLPPQESDSALPTRRTWRSKAQLISWAGYLNGDRLALPEEEKRVVGEVRSFVIRHLHWTSNQEAEDHLRAFVQDLALDQANWPEEKLPGSEIAFKYQALDHVMAGVCRLPDDAESKALTKAQNLRKLWSNRARLRHRLQQEATLDELYEECRGRYGWHRSLFNRLLQLESFCSRPRLK